jgi:predicted PurR-regulated permease PerM
MPPVLQAAVVLGAWILVVLLLAGGYWFLRSHQLLHTAAVIVLALMAAALLIYLRELAVMLLLAGVLAFILDGPIDRFSAHTRRPLAIAAVYLAVAGFLVLLGILVIPAIVSEAQNLLRDLPKHAEQVRGITDRLSLWYGRAPEQVRTAIQQGIEHLQGASAAITRQVEHLFLEFLRWTVKAILIFVMSIYLVTDKERLIRQFVQLFQEDKRADVQEALGELSSTFSRYLRGQATVILFVAVTVTAALLIFGIPYAFFIGAVAGVLEVIPYFGAIAGAIPAVALGFGKSPAVGIALIVIFILINQVEGHLVIPLVMGHHLEMRPLAILVALIAGERLFGIAGMIVAVPVVSMIRVLIPYVQKHYRRFQVREHVRAVQDGTSENAVLIVGEKPAP